MTADVAVRFILDRLPPGIPYRPVVPQIDMIPFAVKRRIIVTIAGYPPQSGILIKTVPTGGIGKERKKALITKIIDPG